MALTAPFWDLGHPLLEVDDARYAEVPREMAETGDWATPRLDYFDYVEKPPLWYWLAASSYKAFGVSEAAARLPLALLAALGILGTAWLGSWLYSPRTGLVAAAALGSSALYFFLSHYITPDLPLAVFLLWCSALALRTLMRPQDGRWAGPGAWACAALAFLSKGLVGLVFPVGWVLALLILFPRLRSGARGLLNPLGPLAFAAIAAPWFLLMERRHPGFLHFFFVEQHFQRFLTQKYNRASPWYFFLLVLPAGLLPWTPAAAAGIVAALKKRRQDPAGLALILWTALVVAFFSMSQSKLATYILPVFPHMALLAASALDGRPPAWARGFAWGLGGALLAAACAAAACHPRWEAEFGRGAILAASGGIAILGASLLAYGRKWAPALALGLGGLAVGALSLGVLRLAAPQLSVRDMGKAIAERWQPGDELDVYGIYLHGLPFYAGHRVDRIFNWTGELHYAKRDPANADRFGGEDSVASLPPPGRRVFLAFRRFEASYVASLASPSSVPELRSFARWELAEFEPR